MSYNPNPPTAIASRQVVTNFSNASVITAIPQGQALSTNGSGLLIPLDVSSQSSWQAFVGYANSRIPTSTLGPVIASGRLENFTTSYPVGTALYVDINGNPTNIVPQIGVGGFLSGFAVIFMGCIVQNETNPSASDISLMTQVIGTL